MRTEPYTENELLRLRDLHTETARANGTATKNAKHREQLINAILEIDRARDARADDANRAELDRAVSFIVKQTEAFAHVYVSSVCGWVTRPALHEAIDAFMDEFGQMPTMLSLPVESEYDIIFFRPRCECVGGSFTFDWTR